MRIQCTHTMSELPAAPAAIFPLLCPVREAEWIPGWEATLLWSRSGHAEAGAVFSTPADPAPWIWHIVTHEATTGRIRFSVTAPGSHLLDLDLALERAPMGSDLRWTYSLLALEGAGAAFLADYEAAFPAKMDLLERRLRHFLTTGAPLPLEVP